MPYRLLQFPFAFALCLSLFCISTAHAQYPTAKANANVREEISGDANRLIPQTEHFAFAVDGESYFRTTGPDEFYHGMGYWLQARSEARVGDNLKLNVRSIFYAGSCSEGYAAATGNYHLFAVTAVAPFTLFDGKITLRGPDLGRQTVGQGLFIQDKEFNGGLVEWRQEHAYLVMRIDGTGLLRLNDDSYNAELSVFDSYVGFGGILWPQGVEQDHLLKERDALLYLFSAHRFDWFSYGAELGERGGLSAGLLAVSADIGPNEPQADTTSHARVKLEARRYNPSFARDFAGRIEQQYVSYDQYDKDFTNASNIFVVDDGAWVEAAHVDGWWKISHRWRLHSLNEIGQFTYDHGDPLRYYYFRQGAEYCFNEGRDDCLNLFVSNKVLMNSYARPPGELSRTNEAMFKTVGFAGLEVRFRF